MQDIVNIPKEECEKKFLGENFNKPEFFEEYYAHLQERRIKKI